MFFQKMHPDQKKTFKEKNDIRKKLFNSTKEERLDWRKSKLFNCLFIFIFNIFPVKDEKKRKNEEKIIKEAEEAKKAKIEKVDHSELTFKLNLKISNFNNSAPPFTISIAVPGQFLNNAQSAELRTYMAGQIARAATLYRVDEIIIYDESCRMTDE